MTEIWKHRNKVVFRGRVVDEAEFFCLVQLKDWKWVKHRMSRTIFSYSD